MNIYYTELIKTLNGELYNGDSTHANLRLIFNDILGKLKITSYNDGETVKIVQLVSVDEEYIKEKVGGYFQNLKNEIIYSKEEILLVLINNIERINKVLSDEIYFFESFYKSVGKKFKSIHEPISIIELRNRV